MVQTGRRGSNSLFSNVGRGISWQCQNSPCKSRLGLKRGQTCVVVDGQSLSSLPCWRGTGERQVESKKQSWISIYCCTNNMLGQVSLANSKGKCFYEKASCPEGGFRNICQMKWTFEPYPSAVIGDSCHIWGQFHSLIGQMSKRNITCRT